MDIFRRGWRVFVLASFMMLLLSVAEGGMQEACAQQPAAVPPSTQEAMPEAIAVQEPTVITGDKEVAEFSASLDLWTKQIGLRVEFDDVPDELAQLKRSSRRAMATPTGATRPGGALESPSTPSVVSAIQCVGATDGTIGAHGVDTTTTTHLESEQSADRASASQWRL